MGYNFAYEVDKIAAHDPFRVALYCVSPQGVVEQCSYEQLRKTSNQVAHALLTNGIAKGTRVLVLLPRGPVPYFVYLGLLKIGATILPGSEMLRAHDIEYRIRHAGVEAVIADKTLTSEVNQFVESHHTPLQRFIVGAEEAEWLPLSELAANASTEDVVVETDDADLAFLSYTSGTTAEPKGVMHGYGWPREHLKVAGTYWFDANEGDLAWATAGPGWAKWVWSPFVSILGNGAAAFIYTGKFHAPTYLELMAEHGVTLLCATPTEYRLMAKADNLRGYDIHLRSACSAGEPLNREVIDTFRRVFGVSVRDGYGQTENSLLVGTLRDMEVRPGSMGRPFPGMKVDIVDDEGTVQEVGAIGHIAVHRSFPALFQGYLNDENRTKDAFRGEWYVTGDQGRKDEAGYIWFEGRADDIIISSGYTIGPFEVEDALVKHPKVAECAVVASPDVERGNIVKAFVILKTEADQEDANLVFELQEHVKKITAPYKYPRVIEFVTELPKTTSGKIRRVELRDRERQKQAASL